jgi:hypothetical protein
MNSATSDSDNTDQVNRITVTATFTPDALSVSHRSRTVFEQAEKYMAIITRAIHMIHPL